MNRWWWAGHSGLRRQEQRSTLHVVDPTQVNPMASVYIPMCISVLVVFISAVTQDSPVFLMSIVFLK